MGVNGAGNNENQFNFSITLINCLITGKIIVLIDEMSYNTKIFPEYLRVQSVGDVICNRSTIKVSRSTIAACTLEEVFFFGFSLRLLIVSRLDRSYWG